MASPIIWGIDFVRSIMLSVIVVSRKRFFAHGQFFILSQMASPKVLEKTREFYNCSSLTGMPLENSPMATAFVGTIAPAGPH